MIIQTKEYNINPKVVRIKTGVEMGEALIGGSIDVGIVGDKLQSLQYVDNFMTSVPDTLPNIKVIK